jgi:undecaprenyl-diphosphatase
MTLLFAALLGVVQGLTEFLPVSSTAHLRIVPALLGRPDPGAAFTAVIQFGTLAAVIVYFAGDLKRMVVATVRHAGELLRLKLPPGNTPDARDARLGAYVILGTLPISICGVILKHLVETHLRSLYVIGFSLILLALVLLMVELWARVRRTMDDLTWVDALIIGGAQALALVPGVSRSGVTLTAALLVGLRREDAARYSFLLSIPAVAAAGLFELKDAVKGGALGGGTLGPLLVATLVAGLVGYGCIAWFLRFLRTRSTVPFVIWRVAVGGLLFALLARGTLQPM